MLQKQSQNQQIAKSTLKINNKESKYNKCFKFISSSSLSLAVFNTAFLKYFVL